MEVETYHFPKYDKDACMATLFEGELGQAISQNPIMKKSHEYFAYNNQDPTLMIVNYILMVS